MLAVIFGGSFVVFGVGSEVPGGIADVLQGRSGSDEPSSADARKKLAAKPNDATALRELATALQREGRAEQAIAPLERYTRQRPNDTQATSELASLYITKATRLRNEAGIVQAQSQVVVPPSDFLPPATSPLGSALGAEPIRKTIEERTQERLAALYDDLQQAFAAAQRTYVQLARQSPEDASIQLQLADAAVNAGDVTTALAAYRRFLRLAPDDPNAPLVRETIKQIQRSRSPGG